MAGNNNWIIIIIVIIIIICQGTIKLATTQELIIEVNEMNVEDRRGCTLSSKYTHYVS